MASIIRTNKKHQKHTFHRLYLHHMLTNVYFYDFKSVNVHKLHLKGVT